MKRLRRTRLVAVQFTNDAYAVLQTFPGDSDAARLTWACAFAYQCRQQIRQQQKAAERKATVQSKWHRLMFWRRAEAA